MGVEWILYSLPGEAEQLMPAQPPETEAQGQGAAALGVIPVSHALPQWCVVPPSAHQAFPAPWALRQSQCC